MSLVLYYEPVHKHCGKVSDLTIRNALLKQYLPNKEKGILTANDLDFLEGIQSVIKDSDIDAIISIIRSNGEVMLNFTRGRT